MPRFEDRDGRSWDLVLGRASWGAYVALFVPVGHDAPVRQSMLHADDWSTANDEIEALATEGLQALLDRSTLKDE